VERVNAKIAENEALKKSKEILDKDYANVSAILGDKMSGHPAVTSQTVKQVSAYAATPQTEQHEQAAQTAQHEQVTLLHEKLTNLSVQHSDLHNKLLKSETEKSELRNELAQLKTQHERTKNQHAKKEGSKLRFQIEKLKSKNVESSNASRNQIKEDKELYAVTIIQSHLRGIKARKEYKDQKYRLQLTQNILSTEHSYLSSLRTLVEFYIEPLRRLAYLTEEEIGVIFSNAQEILKNNTLFWKPSTSV